MGTLVYGFLGVLSTFYLCGRFFSKTAALVAVLIIWLATNLVYYMVVEGSMSHTMAFFVSSLTALYWVRTMGDLTFGRWFKLGALVGLAALVRLQDGVIALLLIAEMGRGLVAGWRRPDAIAPLLRAAVAAGLGFAVVFTPQLLVWKGLYGSFLYNPYQVSEGNYFSWAQPKLLEILLSGYHGLFAWHPILLVGLIGLGYLAWRRPAIFSPMLGVFLLQWYVIAAWAFWWQGDSFGGRMFITIFPFLALGLAAVANSLLVRRQWRWIAATGLIVLIWNAEFMVQYRFGFIPMGERIGFREIVLAKLSLPFDILYWRR